MLSQVFDSNVARFNWRALLDRASHDGIHTIIERYGKPIAVVIPFEQYTRFVQLQEDIDRSLLSPEGVLSTSTVERIPRHPVLRFAGAWADLSDDEFVDFLTDLHERRAAQSQRRIRNASSPD